MGSVCYVRYSNVSIDLNARRRRQSRSGKERAVIGEMRSWLW